MFYALILKYQIVSLGSCKGHFVRKKSMFALVEELPSSLPLNKAALCSERSGDKERQQPSKHV